MKECVSGTRAQVRNYLRASSWKERSKEGTCQEGKKEVAAGASSQRQRRKREKEGKGEKKKTGERENRKRKR
jgi:hypothetical protein